MILEAALLCLSLNVFYEANNEPVEGRYAVAEVTMNRAEQNKQRICNVVLEKKQFSWTNTFSHLSRDKQMQHLKKLASRLGSVKSRPAKHKWEKAVAIAKATLHGKTKKHLENVSYFYNPSIARPRWKNQMRVVARIGNHLFLAAL